MKLLLFYVSFGKIVYRLLQRHRCRRGKRCGRLQCADRELLSLLRFSFCDAKIPASVFMTGGIHIVFDTPFTASLVFLLLNGLYGFVLDFTLNLRTPSTPLQILVSIVFDFWCCKLLFLWIFFCVMKVDFSAFRSFWLLTFPDLMIYMSFDRIFFAKAVIETVFTLRWAEFLDVL